MPASSIDPLAAVLEALSGARAESRILGGTDISIDRPTLQMEREVEAWSTAITALAALGAEREVASWTGADIMKLALIEGALETSIKRAAILRTESIYITAPQARELLAWAKERSAQLIGRRALGETDHAD